MICKVSCIISLVFIIANLYFNFTLNKNKVMKTYENSLTDEQKIIYNNIVKERLQISINGYLLGLLLSIIIITINYNKYKVNKNLIICIVGAVTFIVHYFYYILTPKTDWMLLHIKQEQNNDWLQMYNTMKRNYHISFVIGIISVMIFANSFKC